MSYSELSVTLTKNIVKEQKKKQGIYFTPPSTVLENIKLLAPHMKKVKNVLEPACGSCEFVLHVHEKYPKVNITGIELNKTIFESIQDLENKKITLLHDNFMDFTPNTTYDLIIGNPPFFVMKKKDIEPHYHDYFDGRPNIYIPFIIKSLQLLNSNGILSFVLPKNFLNCLYYDKTRKYINNNFQILHIVECDDKYIETQQETIILMLKKSETTKNNDYCLPMGTYTTFGVPENISKMRTLLKDARTLNSLNFSVNVGNVVWNQCKDILTDDKSKTLLIYSSDIRDKCLEIQTYKNTTKKNYIDKKGNTEPTLVINRGYGKGAYHFEYCLINENANTEYLIENHLICVKNNDDKMLKKDMISLYKKVIASFENKKTGEFIELYFGNNAINTTELCHILPMYGF